VPRQGHITTANLFENIPASEEEDIDYLEANLELIGKLAEQLYLSQLVKRPPTTGGSTTSRF
jgi:bacterioferritin